MTAWTWQVLALGTLTGYLIWLTASTCRKFNRWVSVVVVGVDLLILSPILVGLLSNLMSLPGGFPSELQTLAPFSPLVLITWKLWFFYATTRWEPLRGVFQTPEWPRVPWMRGPGKNRPRSFREPMPWDRGPFTY
jgi:hypothetical protein